MQLEALGATALGFQLDAAGHQNAAAQAALDLDLRAECEPRGDTSAEASTGSPSSAKSSAT